MIAKDLKEERIIVTTSVVYTQFLVIWIIFGAASIKYRGSSNSCSKIEILIFLSRQRFYFIPKQDINDL